MIICVDVDGTICKTIGTDYDNAQPIPSRIKKVNQWYAQGHSIVYWTARGNLVGSNWAEKTKQQLYKWGCKYHELRMGKPIYDRFIDDRAFNADILDKE